MKIEFVSDIHINQWQRYSKSIPDCLNNTEKSDVLCIAGDTSNSVENSIEIITNLLDKFPQVVFVDGNHEHYNYETVNKNKETLKTFASKYSNCHYLDGYPETVIGNVAFIGSNGWYSFDCFAPQIPKEISKMAWNSKSNDSVYINFDCCGPEERAGEDFVSISRALETITVDKVVIVTHTIPNKLLVSKKYQDDYLTPAYVNNYMEMMQDNKNWSKVKIWHFGHTHDPSETIINGVTYINNCVAYPGENKNWTKKIIVSRQ